MSLNLFKTVQPLLNCYIILLHFSGRFYQKRNGFLTFASLHATPIKFEKVTSLMHFPNTLQTDKTRQKKGGTYEQ